MKDEKNRDKRREEIRSEIITSKQALDILGFSRMRLSQIVNDGRITPVIFGVYMKDDILAFKEKREEKEREKEQAE